MNFIKYSKESVYNARKTGVKYINYIRKQAKKELY